MFHRRTQRVIVSASTFVVALAAAEFLLPLLPPHLGTMQRIVHHVDQSGNYYLRPDTRVSFDGMFETISPPVTWQVNHQGFRSESDAGPPSARFRIATYGDSETFGWSVAFDDTFQRRMEKLDAYVEVLNFGIPGYNAENVADRIEATLDEYEPDLIVYLVNKNDVDLPNDISDTVLGSDLLLRMRFLWQVMVTKPWRQQMRQSPERFAFLAGQLDRIANFAEQRRVPVLFAFMKGYTWDGAAAHARPAGFVARTAAHETDDSERVVVVDESLKPFARIDDHLPVAAHVVLAGRLCSEIARDAEGSCHPPQWTASRRENSPARAVVAAGAIVTDQKIETARLTR